MSAPLLPRFWADSDAPAPAWLFWSLVVIGALVVLVGASDIVARLVRAAGDTPAAEARVTGSGLDTFSTLRATTTPLIPARLRIPVIGVNAAVEGVGLEADGAMATPSNFVDVAWYAEGPQPGAAGNAVIAGHVNNALATAGVFEHLDDLALGDTIDVENAAGRTLSYTVVSVRSYPVAAAPVSGIFSSAGPSQLVLITCDGAWDSSAREFDRRLVVTARLAPQGLST